MSNDKNIFGCFVSYPSVMYDATEEQRAGAKNQGDLFRTYIWGAEGFCDILKKLNNEDYGKDLKLVLFQFSINPILKEKQFLKEIEPYRKKEKAIGIPIIVTDENFFNKSTQERYNFLKQSILQKMDVLAEVIKKKNLDTNIIQLKVDLEKILGNVPSKYRSKNEKNGSNIWKKVFGIK